MLQNIDMVTDVQPHSLGSLLPALWSERESSLSRSIGRVGENPGNKVGPCDVLTGQGNSRLRFDQLTCNYTQKSCRTAKYGI